MSNEQAVNALGQTEEEFLRDYNPNEYESPSVTTDIIIFTVAEKEEENYRKLPEKELKVLLIKRNNHPFINQWALPGGFVDMNENLDQCALRELQEETNISNIYIEQLYTWGDVNRDPRKRIISTSYMALIDSSSVNIQAGSDASDVRWFSLKHKLIQEQKTLRENGYVHEKIYQLNLVNGSVSLNPVVKVTKIMEGKVSRIEREVLERGGLAFDHAKIIEYALERLRNKIEYTDIAFNLMPELFTLTELQQVYEIILGRELIKGNFRRKIAPMVVETNQKKKEGGHRHSTLYRFNPNYKEEGF